ncbi:MAG: hypothetical protein ACRDF0_07605, partial [Candidatus Limnocylindria bacterium]
MDLLADLHARGAAAIVFYLAAVGLWGLLLGIRNDGPTSAFRGALVIAEIVAIAVGLFGVGLLATRPLDGLHALYGV